MAYDYEEYEDIDEELDDEPEEENEQMSEAERLQFELEEKVLKNKLKSIFIKASQNAKTKLSITEKRDVKKAKQHPKLKNDINRINLVLASNKAKAVYEVLSSSPVLGYVLVGALILFLVIAAIAAVGSIMPWLFPDDEEGGSGGGVSAAFGITGTDFYGARMVYSDNEKATQTIVEDYVEFVENGIIEAQQITSVTAENGGESFNVELTVNILLPNEEFDYSTFDEADFMSEYADLYQIIYNIAKSVYKTDHGIEFNGSSLIQCVDGIKYFGYGNLAETSMIATNAIIAKTSFISTNDSENKLTQNDINLAVESKVNALYSTYSTARAEKLFVKDFILEGEEMMSGIKKENYVAMIFMPRKNLQFTKLTFAVGGSNLTNFMINVNGETLSTDGYNLGTDEKPSYIYGGTVSITAEKFTDIDETNLTALESEMSLFDVAKLTNASTYLTEISSGGETSVNFLTIKKNGVVVNLFNTEAYNFVEYETTWQATS